MEDKPELDIADVLNYYGAKTVPTGVGWHSVNCPFHGDTHASGRVNVELGAYKCHGCGMSGDAIKLIEDKEGIGFKEACEFARSVLGQSVTPVQRTVSKQAKRRPLGREKWKSILE